MHNLAKTALLEAGLPEFLWPWAIKHAVLIRNILLSEKNPGHSPYKVVYNYLGLQEIRKVNLRALYTFRTKVYIYIARQLRLLKRKIALNTVEGYIIRYVGLNNYIYKVYIPNQRKVVIIRNIKFHKLDPLKTVYPRSVIEIGIEDNRRPVFNTLFKDQASNQKEELYLKLLDPVPGENSSANA